MAPCSLGELSLLSGDQGSLLSVVLGVSGSTVQGGSTGQGGSPLSASVSSGGWKLVACVPSALDSWILSTFPLFLGI